MEVTLNIDDLTYSHTLVESMRKDMNSVVISLSSEGFLCRLFGKPALYTHGTRSQKSWKKILRKVTTAIEKAIRKNVISDGFHNSRLHGYIEHLKEACRSKRIRDIDIILDLTGIVFELLGEVPDYTGRRRLNRHDDYYLKGLRSLHYEQTPLQKANTILEAARYEPWCDYHKSDDLFQVYVSQYNGNPEGFIKWYKDTYPKVYLELF